MSRDTQFAGFAKALWDELPDLNANSLIAFDEWSAACEKIITARAYDLVRHTCEEIAVYEGYGRSGGHSLLEQIPDMTEFSGGVQ